MRTFDYILTIKTPKGETHKIYGEIKEETPAKARNAVCEKYKKDLTPDTTVTIIKTTIEHFTYEPWYLKNLNII